MLTGKRRLNRMQDTVIGEIFDRDQFRAIDLTEQRDARIHRLVNGTAVALPHDNDSTGTAIALGTALFGAGRAFL
jgi:hypothetical protein